MRRTNLVILVSLPFLLIGCASQTSTLFYKKGMVFGTNQKDYDACKIKSFKTIPQNIVSEYKPGFYSPGTVSCSTIGYSTSCNTYGGVNIPATITNYDANENLRLRHIVDCMSSKGYRVVTLKNCGYNEEGYNSLTKAPPLDKIKCFEKDSPQIDF